MKTIDSKKIVPPVAREIADDRDGRVKISLLDLQQGSEVRAVRCRGNDRFGSYSFRVTDKERCRCAYPGADEPPIDLIQAVEKFGYHVTNVGSYPLERVNLQHVRRIHNTISDICSTTEDPLLSALLSNAEKSLEDALFYLNLRVTIVENHKRSVLDRAIHPLSKRLQSKHDDEGADIGEDESHQEFAQVATDGGCLTSDELASARQFDDQQGGDATVRLNTVEVSGSRKLHVTLYDRNHADRYTFNIINTKENVCAVQNITGETRLPPIGVVKKVNERGYEITNTCVPQSNDPTRERLADADHSLDSIRQSYHHKNPLDRALEDGQDAIQTAVSVASHRDAMQPKKYLSTLVTAAKSSPLTNSLGDLDSSLSIEDLNKFVCTLKIVSHNE